MTTNTAFIEVSDQKVEVVFKDIKNLHLSVHPPEGRVRVAAPLRLDEEAVRLAVVSRLGWIHKQQSRLLNQERQSRREMVTGESHYFRGQRYRLRVIDDAESPSVRIRGRSLELRARNGMDRDEREALLTRWYRKEIKMAIPELLSKWEPVIGVQAASWGVKRMKTRWGSCNPNAQRIWLNLELAKKHPQCLEYVLVHELVHLIEHRHDSHFRELMDRFLPLWPLHRDELNRSPLAHADWSY